jgi:hypothetical protein|tara:strand:- start:358 stop:558 length:201 start_codon:yes stop_codon:yes gene_type:complete
MNAAGARRWMFHMNLALQEHEDHFNRQDVRCMATIRTFLRVKVKKYADDFGWAFDERLHPDTQTHK